MRRNKSGFNWRSEFCRHQREQAALYPQRLLLCTKETLLRRAQQEIVKPAQEKKRAA